MPETYLYFTEAELLRVAKGDITFAEMLVQHTQVLQNKIGMLEDEISLIKNPLEQDE